MNKTIELNEQQVEFLKSALIKITEDDEYSNTTVAVALQIINKLKEK